MAALPFHSRNDGFTLVEVVVALTLVSLIMLGLVSAMRSMAAASARVNQVSARTSDIQLISGFLGRAFSSIQAGTVQTEEADQGPVPFFDGRADRIQWIGLLPARFGGGGMQLFELGVEQVSGRGSVLMLQYIPYGNEPDWSLRSQHVLQEGLEQLSISYQGDEPGDEWVDEWSYKDLLVFPARVKISIRVAGRYWPELIYALDPL